MRAFTYCLVFLAFAGWSRIASATVILEYMGFSYTKIFAATGPTAPPDFYQSGDRIEGWIELPNMLAPNMGQNLSPISFSFTDGVNTIDNTLATATSFVAASTDANGLPTHWEVLLENLQPGPGGTLMFIQTSTFGTPLDQARDALCGPTSPASSCFFSGDPHYLQGAETPDAPGFWSYKQISVPSPSTLSLFALGLAGIGFSRRKKA